MSMVDLWTDDHIEKAIKLLVDGERLVLWHRLGDGYNGPLPNVELWLKDVRAFLVEEA